MDDSLSPLPPTKWQYAAPFQLGGAWEPENMGLGTGSWVDGNMEAWESGNMRQVGMGAWKHGNIRAWRHGSIGAWEYRGMGARVHGIM
jgi:hypothetical protein